MRLIPLLAAILLIVGACEPTQTQFVPPHSGKSSRTSAVEQAAATRLDVPAPPLSAMARLGQKMFFDASLSGSGKLSCASCHDPGHAYSPAMRLRAMRCYGENINAAKIANDQFGFLISGQCTHRRSAKGFILRFTPG
jgi:cytochrome c peroxidase